MSARSAVEEAGEVRATDVRAVSTGLEIVADRVAWSVGTATFDGAVTVRRGDVELRASHVDAVLEGARLSGAVATGDVVVRRGAWEGRAGVATLDAAAGTLALTDGVEVADGSRHMSARAVTVWLDAARVSCDQCRIRFAADPLAAP